MRKAILIEYEKRIKWNILKINNIKDFNDPYYERRDFCYLVRNDDNELYKIGVTRDYNTRYSQLDRSRNIKTILLIQIANGNEFGDSHWLEAFIKDYYKSKSEKKEWFKFTKRDVSDIRDLFWEIFGDDIWDEDNPLLIKDLRSNLYKQIG